jgi:hypothetical protein
MRSFLLCSAVAALVATPVGCQTCKRGPAPFLPDLFPRSVAGLNIEFSGAPGGGCMGMYRPEDPAARESQPWALVSIDVETDESLGVSADRLRAHYAESDTHVIDVDGWPVAVTAGTIGDEFTTVKGSLRISVIVRNGDHGQKSRDFAMPFLRQILAKVPCG